MRSSARKIFFLLLFVPHFLFSENNDSLKKNKKNPPTQFFTETQFENPDSANQISYSLLNFQNYLERNHLGNSGLAFADIYIKKIPGQTGFHYWKNPFENYFYTPQNLKFYNTHSPYTDLFYIIGSKKEQDFKMTFSYNVKKNWNLTADFFRIRSEGVYARQATNDNFIAVSSNYKSANNRYWLLSGLIYNYAQNAENGGISNDSLFENDGNGDKKLLDINLQSAKRSVLNRNIFIKQYLNFGRREYDTAENSAIIPGSRLILTSVYDDNLLKYEDEDPLSGFYSTIYNDSTNTFDSSFNSRIENELAWKRVDNTLQRGLKDMFGVAFSVKDQFVKIKQREIDTSFNNVIGGVAFYNTYSKNKFWWNVSGKYVFTGYNKDDFNAGGTLTKGIKDSLIILSFTASAQVKSPDFIYHRYSSNNFRWDNDFEKIQENNAGIDLNMKKYKFVIGAEITKFTNPVYFDNYAIARQYKGSVSVMSAFLKKDFVLYNWHLNNVVHYQLIPDSTIIRAPEFVLEHSLYYENDLFKGAMHLEIGASVFFTSAYYANSYMPATAQFYLQDDKKYGNYPFIDFFINAQIKTMRIFFKIDHLNSGWMGNHYMQIPHYPMNDRAFKVGISWRFFD